MSEKSPNQPSVNSVIDGITVSSLVSWTDTLTIVRIWLRFSWWSSNALLANSCFDPMTFRFLNFENVFIFSFFVIQITVYLSVLYQTINACSINTLIVTICILPKVMFVLNQIKKIIVQIPLLATENLNKWALLDLECIEFLKKKCN